MKQYTKVTFKVSGNKRRTICMEISRDDGVLLTGYEVNREGERITKKTTNGWAEYFYIIGQKDIIKRIPLRMNLHYGELEPVESYKKAK